MSSLPTLGLLWKKFFGLRPDQPRLVGTVSVVHGDGRYRLNLASGGVLEARGEGDYLVGSKVFVQGKNILGPASSLPPSVIEV